jgi:hypothetical protein
MSFHTQPQQVGRLRVVGYYCLMGCRVYSASKGYGTKHGMTCVDNHSQPLA